MNASDRELAKRAAEGEHAAFEEIYRRNKKIVFAAVLSMTRNYFEAEDICQEAFLRAYQSIGGYSGAASLTRWLRAIAVNLCIDRMRRKGISVVSWPRTPCSDEEEMDVKDPGPCPLDILENKSTEEMLIAAIKSLPCHYRQVAYMHDVQGLNGHEIAAAIRCPEGTVKSRLHRAHKMLGRLLGSELEAGAILRKKAANILEQREMVAG